MARGRIFSSRRMFSTRRDAFAESSRNAGPLGVVLGVAAAGIIIFVIGVYVGASFPSIFGLQATAPTPAAMPAPLTGEAPDMETPAVTFAPEPDPVPEAVPEFVPAPDATAPTSVAPLTPTEPEPAPASTPSPAPATP
ncbi:MAG: hypothetical protein Q7T44_10830 [Parvibaculum sp.]|nr:hypothetical protein [Parvibaculum sp.]